MSPVLPLLAAGVVDCGVEPLELRGYRLQPVGRPVRSRRLGRTLALGNDDAPAD